MKRYFSNTFWVALFTIISQILGYVREMLFAYYLGTTSEVEAFQVAETIPLLFTQVLVGAIPLALTPLLVREIEDGKDELLHNAIALCMGVMCVAEILVLIFHKGFVNLVAPGFYGNKYIITCRLVIILMPNIIFLSIAALFNSFLNAHKQFIVPAVASLALNLSIVIFQIMTKANIYCVALGSVIGGTIMFLIVLLYSIKKYKYRFKYRNLKIACMKKLILAIIPVGLISSFTSINLMVDKYFASQLAEGTIAILTYSYKVVNLPVYLFVTSVTKVILPDLTLMIQKKESKKLSILIRNIVILCIAAGVLTVIIFNYLGEWIVHLLFGRGAFDSGDVAATADALKLYVFGITGMALGSFFQSISYAGTRYFEPLKVLIVQFLIYIFVTRLSISVMGVNGIVLGNVMAVSIAIIFWLIILKKNYEVDIFRGNK